MKGMVGGVGMLVGGWGRVTEPKPALDLLHFWLSIARVTSTTLQKLIVESEGRGTTLQKLIASE